METQILGRLDDVSHLDSVCHALPLDGLPGSAPEYLIDRSRTGAVTRIDEIVLALP